MTVRWIIAPLCLLSTALAQSPQAARYQAASYKDETAPQVAQVLPGPKIDGELLASLLSINPQVPLGPEYVLQGYEKEMTLVSQKMSVELQSIELALRSGQITHDEAEYLIQQRYQVAMMQYEVFSALHDALEEEIQKVASRSRTFPAGGSDHSVAAHAALAPARSQNQ
jgi:hypothetical protein